ncbi:hypothetical protein FQA39_LY11687 [Lamprigera yunnana]|nr:hypothetical protein FQA39_LY11687 [Lamprigera yunnana]
MKPVIILLGLFLVMVQGEVNFLISMTINKTLELAEIMVDKMIDKNNTEGAMEYVNALEKAMGANIEPKEVLDKILDGINKIKEKYQFSKN